MIKALCFAAVFLFPSFAWPSVSVTVNGVAYTIPQTNERNWGTNVTSWIQAISSNTLQPSGGTFTLGADIDFGGSFGLKSTYYKTRTANLSSAGQFRLANTDSIGWRNNANGGDLLLSADTSDRLNWNGHPIASSAGLVPVGAGGTGIASGTSGGVLAFTASGTIASSGALTANQVVIGGGAGAAPSVIAAGTQYQSLTMGAANPGYSAVNLAQAAAITGALPIGNGGTGQVTAQAAIDALLPSQGSNSGKFLTTNGSASSWGSVANTIGVATKTSNYTATSSDDLILCNTNAFTVTLPAVSSNSGKVLRIQKIGSDTNAITIARAGSDTINGATSYVLSTQYEEVMIVSDGTATWYVLAHTYPSTWASTTLGVTAVTSNPTKGAITRDQVLYRRVGDSLEVIVNYIQSTSGAAAGSGVYLFAIPNSLTATTLATNTSANNDSNDDAGFIGMGNVSRSSAQQGIALAYLYDSTHFYIKFGAGASDTTGTTLSTMAGDGWGSGSLITFAHNLQIVLRLLIPISGWQG